MRLLFGSLLAFVIASSIGLGTTWLTLSRTSAFSPITLGAWKAWPRTGTLSIDPYARALIARTGELPVGSGDGVAFYAQADDERRPLDGRCEVVLGGITPPARFWTLTLYDPEGRLVANGIDRQVFTSQEIVRKPDGIFEITVSPRARAGNWLPTGGIERYQLVLRLYDTPVGITTRAGRESPMPSVRVRACS